MPPTVTTSAQNRREFWLFVLFALVVLGAGIGLRDPWPADEPRFALAAKQMVESGNWLIPHRGSEIYADKPPTFMALEAAMYSVFGNWRIAFLLPSLLAGLGTLLLVYDLARRLWGQRSGLFAAGALLVTFQFVYQVKRAQIDPAEMFLISAANYGLLRHFLLGPNWRMYWFGCFAAGLGVITKGVGIIALLLALPYIYARFTHWEFAAITRNSALRWFGGAIAFLAAIALWLVPLAIAVGLSPAPDYAAYLHDILFKQTAARYAQSWDHPQPVWYFVGVILSGWAPLWLTWFGTIPAWWRSLKARDARYLLPLAWVLLVLVFFSIPHGKRDMYILPALPMVALCSGPILGEILQRRWARIVALAITAILGMICLAGGGYATSGKWKLAQEFVSQRGFGGGGIALWGMLIVLGFWMLLCVAYFRFRRGVHALVAGFAGLWLVTSLWGYPLLNDSNSARGVMQHAGAIIGPDAELALVAWKEQNLLLADRKAADFGFVKPWHLQLGEAIRWQEAEPAKRWIFILADALAPCIDQGKAQYVGHANRREWWVFRSDAVIADCRGGTVPTPGFDDSNDPNSD
jgi:4-amino-4-deoxy-L-arabinose transferase-like glycosyltransferase